MFFEETFYAFQCAGRLTEPGKKPHEVEGAF